MGNLTLLSVNCCREESDGAPHRASGAVLPDRKGEDFKAAQTCVVRWTAVPTIAATQRRLPDAPPAVPLPRSVSQATTLPGDFR